MKIKLPKTTYCRKMAQVAHRDGTIEIKEVAIRVMNDRNPRKRDKRIILDWFRDWLDKITLV